jgi:hypothetical protein
MSLKASRPRYLKAALQQAFLAGDILAVKRLTAKIVALGAEQ